MIRSFFFTSGFAKRVAVLFVLCTGVLLMDELTPEEIRAQEQANYDESKIPEFTLPNPLVSIEGEKVDSADAWPARRVEILQLFNEHMYGAIPKGPAEISFDVVSEKVVKLKQDDQQVAAVRKEVDVSFADKDGPKMRILVYLPVLKKQVPVFLGLNFRGNHATTDDREVSITDSWVPNDKKIDVTNNKSNEKARGMAKSRWPYFDAVQRGYGIATIYCGDIDPDFDDAFKNGVHALDVSAGRNRDPSSWATISGWSYGLMRAMDYFEKDKHIDAKRVAIVGHSRLGKTSLWAGANDPRFAMVVSNDSGCGGAALSRRRIGESVKRINTSFPHWFNDKFIEYNHNEDACPIDQHCLVALIAPRPVYIASASEDKWADPKGEFLAALHADPVYRLLSGEGLSPKEFPEVNSPIHGRISYHIREGKHDITAYDWKQYMDVADQMMK